MTTPPRQTKTGKLSDLARHVVLPAGIVSTGWPAVREKCSSFGVTFDDWQDGAGRLILAKRADGSYACSIGGVVMSIPRQVGKTFLIGAIVFALCLLNPGLTVLWTAHRLRTADETFAKMQAFARKAKVKPHVAKIVLGSGDETIAFHNGSRILFGARERGFGRGFDDVDVEVFDEAQILTENAIDDMIPAMNTATNPLPIYIGTPPKPTDPSEVFTKKRSDALSGEDEDTAYVEFSADSGCSPEDRKQWAKANPSHPKRTPESAMLRMKKNLTLESFLREGLGIWDDVTTWGVIPAALWEACASPSEEQPAVVCFAADATPERTSGAIAVAGRRKDGSAVVEIVDQRPGVDWIAERLVELVERHTPLAVVIDRTGPAGTALGPLEREGVELTVPSASEIAQSAGGFFDAVTERDVVHQGDARLGRAVAGAKQRKIGQAWGWDRRGVLDDVSPLVAASFALWGLLKSEATEPRVWS